MSAIGQPDTQKQAASPRPDPSAGDLYGPIAMTDLVNKDPNRHYVFVSRNRQALAEYRRMGYQPEIGRGEGHVHVAGEATAENQEIECMDHVLMSVSKERHQSIEQEGAFGGAGQKRADAIDKLIIDKSNVVDHFRGLNVKRGEHVRVYNQTSSLEEEI